MIALYIILMKNTEDDSEELRKLKALIYSLTYVDNSAVTCNSKEELMWAYEQLGSIFNPHQFFLQQYCTNDPSLQATIDVNQDTTPRVVKLFGLAWDRENDTIFTGPLHLDPQAATKRAILSSIASNYDVFLINGPMLNRARLFMHTLQCDRSVDWDTKLDSSRLREWVNISNQVNNSPGLELPRCMGPRNGSYNLVVCTDASKTMYGAVLYLQNCGDKSLSFVAAKNRIVNKQLESKSVPCLEFHAISLGVEMLFDYLEELSGDKCVTPIKIGTLTLCSDSAISLHWLNSACHKLDKLQKLTPFVKNRLNKITKYCEKKPVNFKFISGTKNPADCISRCLSHKQLTRSNYISGPDLDEINSSLDNLDFVIPAPPSVEISTVANVVSVVPDHMVDVERFSSCTKLFIVQGMVLQFINKLKIKVNAKYNRGLPIDNNIQLHRKTWNAIIMSDQRKYYPEVLDYFRKPSGVARAIPPIIAQLNLYLDEDKIVRVQSKFERWADHNKYPHPVLLSKESNLTCIIIQEIHVRKSHAGCYSVLNDLRRKFYVPHHFSVTKRVLKRCTTCRRVNARPIRITQNCFREFRVSPPNIPFRFIYVDHFGPYFVKINGTKQKVWVLCISCLWCRGINLKLCTDLSVSQYLRALQLHIMEFGTAELLLSDSGSQLIAGSNIVKDLVNDLEVQKYLLDNGIKSISFHQYSKGNPDIGGLVESCVKISKRLINGCIRCQVLDVFDFQFVLAQTVCIANKRPIAFKESLRDPGIDHPVPAPITPEILLRGHDLVTLNVLPSTPIDIDPDWTPDADTDAHIRSSFDKLNKNRLKLVEIYQNEFIADLTRQATNKPDRYASVDHKKLDVGDLVLLVEQHVKSVNFPMGIVRSVVTNSLGEVTDAMVMKGNREVVKRHVKGLILLLKNDLIDERKSNEVPNVGSNEVPNVGSNGNDIENVVTKKRQRRAALSCKKRMAKLADENLV